MNHTPFDLERHIDVVIDRIASDRLATQHLPVIGGASPVANRLRERVGKILINIGERVGGPAVRGPKPTSPIPTHTPLLGF